MKASEVIKILEELKKEYGDKDVVFTDLSESSIGPEDIGCIDGGDKYFQIWN